VNRQNSLRIRANDAFTPQAMASREPQNTRVDILAKVQLNHRKFTFWRLGFAP
jgi:hypothetical protein